MLRNKAAPFEHYYGNPLKRLGRDDEVISAAVRSQFQPERVIAGYPIDLAPGHSRRVRVTFRIDSSVPAGSYFLIASAAPQIQPPDTNHANDTTTNSTKLILSA